MHRHLVLTIPRLLRPLFRRRRELLTELGRAAAEATSELVRRGVGGVARPGMVVSIATAGDLVRWHPHLHLLRTDGGKTANGSWRSLPEWDALLLMRLFRKRLLARLVEAHHRRGGRAIRKGLAEGYRGPVLLEWLEQLMQDRDERRRLERESDGRLTRRGACF